MTDSSLRRVAAAGLLAMLALAACRESGGESEPFAVSGKLFVFNYRVATATALVTLAPLRPVGEGTATARFEDPAGGEAIEVRQRIWPKSVKVVLETPPLRCIVKDRPYAVSIAIAAADGTLLQTIDTTMRSSQDQTVLPDRPLVVGPVYTPNPELAGHPDGKLPDSATKPCPTGA